MSNARGDLVDEQAEPFQRGGVHPVQVFHDKTDRLPLRLSQQPGQQRFEGLLLLPLGRQSKGSIAISERQ